MVKYEHDILEEDGAASVDNMLGSRIKYLRKRHHYSQKKLATELGVSNVQLSRYETGDRKPDPDTIVHIANFFHVSADFLLGLATSVHDSNSAYMTDEELALLEQIKENPELERVLKEILASSEQKTETFVKMWDLFRSQQD
ncbi:MAG TPA: helix-turn-helix transcriptional regulator [Bacillales bacterium]|nr:helix-turn-helix transcriptional regulator [Bacillales bacterium]